MAGCQDEKDEMNHRMPETVDKEDAMEVNHSMERFIMDFCKQLSDEDLEKARKRFCSCTKPLIDAYKASSQQVQQLRNEIKVLEKTNHQKDEKIKELEATIATLKKRIDLTSCQICGKKTNETPLQNFTEGRGMQGEENDEEWSTDGPLPSLHKSDEKPPVLDVPDLRCICSCGWCAVFLLFLKKEIRFCPIKFIQKIGTRGRRQPVRCVSILNQLKDLDFVEKVYRCDNILGEGGLDKVLKTAQEKLIESGHEEGLLSYSVGYYSHCVTMINAKSIADPVQVVDASKNVWFGHESEENWKDIQIVEVTVLKEVDGEILIAKKWYPHCGDHTCQKELDEMSELFLYQLSLSAGEVSNPEN